MHAGVRHSLLKCNEIKRKLAKCRDPALGDATQAVGATAAHSSDGGDTLTPGGRVPASRATAGRAFDDVQRAPELSHF